MNKWLTFLQVCGVMVLCGGLVFGCTCKYTEIDGTITDNYTNCFKKAQDTACKPPANVMNIITAAGEIIATALNALVPGSTAFINAANAKGYIDTLQQTGCIGLTQLNSLIAYLQSADYQQVQVVAAQVAAKKGLKGFPVPPNIQPLVELVGKVQIVGPVKVERRSQPPWWSLPEPCQFFDRWGVLHIMGKLQW